MSHYFLAVPLPGEVRAHLSNLAESFKQHLKYGYWTDEADYHITLLFLGEASPSQIDALKECLHDRTKALSGIHISLKGFGTFGKKEQPRVLWMGVEHDSHLTELYSAVRNCVGANGFEVETRPYRPHITIAKKWRGPSSIPSEQWHSLVPTFEPFSWKANEFRLYKVEPGKTPRYISVEHYPLI